MKLTINRIIAGLLVLAGLASSGWLLYYHHFTRLPSEDGGWTVSQNARYTADRANNLPGAFYDRNGTLLSSTIQVPVEPEPEDSGASGADTPDVQSVADGIYNRSSVSSGIEPEASAPTDGSDALQDRSGAWTGGFFSALLAYIKGVPTPSEATAEEEPAAEQSSPAPEVQDGVKTVSVRHIEDAYDETMACILSPSSSSSLERRYETELINGNFAGINTEYQEGDSFILTIDAGLQNAIHETLQSVFAQKGLFKGGAVLLDREGRVLAMVSLPAYSGNAYFDGDTVRQQSDLIRDRTNQLYWNQTMYARNYGSACKPITALSILRSGIDQRYTEVGSVVIGGTAINCVYGHTHDGRQLTLDTAMRDSSNTYFAQKLVEAGGALAAETASSLLLDEDQSISMDFGSIQSSYSFSSDAELALCGFGQGGFTVSPLQLAMTYLAIANGDLYQPYLIQAQVQPDGTIRSETVPTVLAEDVITEEERAALKGALLCSGDNYNLSNESSSFRICAKSGTAQSHITVNGMQLATHNIVMSSYFPADDPQYSLVVFACEDTSTSHYGSELAEAVRSIADLVVNSAE